MLQNLELDLITLAATVSATQTAGVVIGDISGPAMVVRYNMYPAAPINGETNPTHSEQPRFSRTKPSSAAASRLTANVPLRSPAT